MAFQIANFVICVNQTDAHQYVIQKYVVSRYGTKVGDPRYDARADINGDGIIDISDTAKFSADPQLTLKTFGVSPVLWYQVAVPLGLGLVGVTALTLLRKS